jgi:hypothetical protein
MKFQPVAFLRSINAVDIAVYFSTLVFFMWDVPLPATLAALLTSVYGLFILGASALYMLFYLKPFTGVVSLALIYRVYQLSLRYAPYAPLTNSNTQLQGSSLANPMESAVNMREMSSVLPTIRVSAEPTLEESIVAAQAPIGESPPMVYAIGSNPVESYTSDYRPVNSRHTYSGADLD